MNTEIIGYIAVVLWVAVLIWATRKRDKFDAQGREPSYRTLSEKIESGNFPKAIVNLMRQSHVNMRNEIGKVTACIELAYRRGIQEGQKLIDPRFELITFTGEACGEQVVIERVNNALKNKEPFEYNDVAVVIDEFNKNKIECKKAQNTRTNIEKLVQEYQSKLKKANKKIKILQNKKITSVNKEN